MSRPALEVADILRVYAGRFLERSRARVSWPQHKVMRAIEALPHRPARQTSRPMHQLRQGFRLLLQLLPYGEYFLMGSSASASTLGWPFRLD